MSDAIPEQRHEGRQPILMDVRCRLAPGRTAHVSLSQISTTGCQFRIREGLVAVGQHVVVKAKGLEGLPGAIRWVLGDRAGMAFEQPLHPAVLDHLLGVGEAPTYRPSPTLGHAGRSGRSPVPHPHTRRSCL